MALGQYRILGITDAKILYNVTGTVTKLDLHFVNTVEINPEEETIEFTGDDQKVVRYAVSGMNGTITQDTIDITDLGAAGAFGKTEQTGISGVASRTYWGDETEAAGITRGLEFKAKAEKLSDGSTKDIVITVPRARIAAVRPPSLANKAKAQLQLRFSAERTTTDIGGNALTGVPTNGAFWYFDELS